MKSPDPHTYNHPKLWNPKATCNWSILLTAAFGSYLQHKNWLALGQPERAASSKRWFFVTLVLLTIYILTPDHLLPFPSILKRTQFIILVLWYWFSGRTQARYVKENLPAGFAKRPWGKPIMIGMACMFAYYVLILCAMYGLKSMGVNYDAK